MLGVPTNAKAAVYRCTSFIVVWPVIAIISWAGKKEDLKPRQAEAMHELKRMLRSTSKVGRALLLSVCGEGRSVKEFETAAGWRPRYGIERLREALDDVAECRGLITRRISP